MQDRLTGPELDMSDGRLLRARIRSRMEELKTNAKVVSNKAELGDTAVSDILNSRSRSPSIETATKIAKALDCDVGYLIGEQDRPRLQPLIASQIEPIRIAGVAEAGSFRFASSAPPDTEYEMGTVVASRSPRYSQAKHFAYEVRGNSMNAATRKGRPAPITEGMLVLCVDVIEAGLEIESGEIYVVRRTTDSGQTYEFAVKKAVVYRDRTELRSESTDPRYETLVIPHDRDPDPAREILAIGWVYAALIDFSSPT